MTPTVYWCGNGNSYSKTPYNYVFYDDNPSRGIAPTIVDNTNSFVMTQPRVTGYNGFGTLIFSPKVNLNYKGKMIIDISNITLSGWIRMGIIPNIANQYTPTASIFVAIGDQRNLELSFDNIGEGYVFVAMYTGSASDYPNPTSATIKRIAFVQTE